MENRVRFLPDERVDEPDATAISTLTDIVTRRITQAIGQYRRALGTDMAGTLGCVLKMSTLTQDTPAVNDLTIAAGLRLLVSAKEGSGLGETPYGEVYETADPIAITGALPTTAWATQWLMARVGADSPSTNEPRVFFDGISPIKEKVVSTDVLLTRPLEWLVVDITGLTAAQAAGYVPAMLIQRKTLGNPCIITPLRVFPYSSSSTRFSGGEITSAAQAISALANLIEEMKGIGQDWDDAPVETLYGLNTRVTTAEVDIATLQSTNLWNNLDYCRATSHDGGAYGQSFSSSTSDNVLIWNGTDIEDPGGMLTPTAKYGLTLLRNGRYFVAITINFAGSGAGNTSFEIWNNTKSEVIGKAYATITGAVGALFTVTVTGGKLCDSGDEIQLRITNDTDSAITIYDGTRIELAMIRG